MTDERPGHEPRIDRWTDLLRPTYQYPEDDADESEPAPGEGRQAWAARRRRRRTTRRAWRRHDKQARQDWVAQRRRELDANAEDRAGCVAVAVVLALVLVGGFGLLRGCSSQPSAQPDPTTTTSARGTVPDPSAAATTAPSATPTPQANTNDDAPPEPVIEAWVRAWFTFTPTTGDQDGERFIRTEPYMTDELRNFLWQIDPTITYYEAEGIDVEVHDVAITAPPEGTTPIDHPTRATRLVQVTRAYTTGPDAGEQITSTHVVTCYRLAPDAGWLVGDYTQADH